MPRMKLKVGETYTTVAGEKAVVLHRLRGQADWPYLGYYVGSLGWQYGTCWNAEGGNMNNHFDNICTKGYDQ